MDWERPDLRVLLFRGQFGEIRRSDGAFEVELRGLAEALNAPVGRSVLRTCDRALGDAKCGFDTTQPGFAGEGGRGEARSGASLVGERDSAGFADGWFTHGALTWLSGANAGEIGGGEGRQARTGRARGSALWQRRGGRSAAGDRFRVVAGCDKTCGDLPGEVRQLSEFPRVPAHPRRRLGDGLPQGRSDP